MIQTKIIEKYFFYGLLFATLIFTFFIFRPFWVVLVLGISFAIVLYPLYEWMVGKNWPKFLAAFTTVFCFSVVLCGPLLGIGTLVFNQSQSVYHFFTDQSNSRPILDNLNNAVNQFLPENVNFDVPGRVSSFASYASNNVADIFRATISAFFSFFLMLLIIFYFLRDGEKWKRGIIILSPLADKDDQKIIKRLEIAVNSVVKGNLFIAVLQGVLMGLGLTLFHVPNGALWGVVAAVASFLPTFGTAFVSIPAILFLFGIGDNVSAFGLLIWSVLIVGTVDNILTPILIGSRTHLPPLLVLFSVLGGISLFGPVGILVGPLTISLLYTLISIYRNEFKQNEQ